MTDFADMKSSRKTLADFAYHDYRFRTQASHDKCSFAKEKSMLSLSLVPAIQNVT